MDTSQSTDFNTILDEAIASQISKLNTSFMGQIKAINSNDTISIQPVLKRQIDDEIFTIPIIEDVEFLQNYSSDGFSASEFKIGDYLLCVALQRDHTDFFDTLVMDVATTKRSFNIADIVALPFGFPSKEKLNTKIKGWSAKSTTSIKLNFADKGFFELSDLGLKIELNGVNVLEVISQSLAALGSATVTTPDGVFPLDNASAFTNLKSQIDKIKG